MKLKYYLRGTGVGVIVTTLIFTIAIAFGEPTLSREDIIREAEKLGMVSQEKAGESGESKKEDTKNAETSKENDTKGEDEGEVTEKVTFAINRGDTSAVVSAHLQEMGLVDDGEAFDKFLSEQNFDNYLQPGEHSIPKNSSFLDIAKILTTKKE